VHRYFAAHGAAALGQSLLVHGLAGVALAGVVIALRGHLGSAARTATGAAAAVTGLAAAAASFVQVGLAVALHAHVAGGGGASGTKAWFDAINTADAVKLLLLAVFVAATTVAARPGRLPRWLAVTGAALVPLLVLGGTAFVVSSAGLDAALAASLLVLLIWVGGASTAMLRAGRTRRNGRPVS
jgi:hypothetical protein